MVHTPIALGFFVYAAYQRGQMRKKFGIAGSEIEDYLCWVVCGLCTLCQETRTLASNDVEAGCVSAFASPLSFPPRCFCAAALGGGV